MVAGDYDFTIEQGATFSKSILYKDSNGDAVNLSGYTARMQVRVSYGTPILLELTTENGGISLNSPTGYINLLASEAVTSALDFVKARYDLELVNSGVVTRFLMGNIFLSREVTRNE